VLGKDTLDIYEAPMFTGIVTAIGTIRQATRPATFGHDHLPL
jgi:hypothetical protein